MLTAQTAWSAWWLLPFAAPIGVWVAWSDMKRMKIPNRAVIALVLVFASVGLVALPLEVWAWRWVHLAIILAAGFVANAAGLMGAGDAKFAAAMAPFVARGDVILVLYLFSAVLLAGYLTHRLARAIPAIRHRTPDWESWTRSDFPMGLCLGSFLIVYLALGAIAGQ